MAISASMPKAVAHGIEGLEALKDQVVGPSAWREVTQEMVNQFAELTGDDQWIHTDVERAKTESPYGTTIAHGNLTLSLIDGMRKDLSESSGFVMGVNYGWNKVRFPAPVPVGSACSRLFPDRRALGHRRWLAPGRDAFHRRDRGWREAGLRC